MVPKSCYTTFVKQVVNKGKKSQTRGEPEASGSEGPLRRGLGTDGPDNASEDFWILNKGFFSLSLSLLSSRLLQVVSLSQNATQSWQECICVFLVCFDTTIHVLNLFGSFTFFNDFPECENFSEYFFLAFIFFFFFFFLNELCGFFFGFFWFD